MVYINFGIILFLIKEMVDIERKKVLLADGYQTYPIPALKSRHEVPEKRLIHWMS